MSDSDATLSKRLLRANQDVWDVMQAHRFVQDIEADRLPADVFARYLVFEHRFVETAILIFGHAMLKAPAPAQRHRLIGILHALSTEQLPAFGRFFAALGIVPASAATVLPMAVHAFDRGMLQIAEEGDYGDGLAAMLAAEWMYATWCGRAGARTTPISSPELRLWVALHNEPGFVNQVAWLRAEVDACACSDASRLSARFRRALELEVAFHEAAYDVAWPVCRKARVFEA